MPMRRSTKQKIFVLIIAFIFLGSYASFAISTSSSYGPSSQQAQIPKERILTELNPQSQEAIIGRGGVVIKIEMPAKCEGECAYAKARLEALTNTYPIMFLVESQGMHGFLIRASGYYNSTTFDSYNETAIEDFICGGTPLRPQSCILRKF